VDFQHIQRSLHLVLHRIIANADGRDAVVAMGKEESKVGVGQATA
jgi:hypothetical protein